MGWISFVLGLVALCMRADDGTEEILQRISSVQAIPENAELAHLEHFELRRHQNLKLSRHQQTVPRRSVVDAEGCVEHSRTCSYRGQASGVQWMKKMASVSPASTVTMQMHKILPWLKESVEKHPSARGDKTTRHPTTHLLIQVEVSFRLSFDKVMHQSHYDVVVHIQIQWHEIYHTPPEWSACLASCAPAQKIYLLTLLGHMVPHEVAGRCQRMHEVLVLIVLSVPLRRAVGLRALACHIKRTGSRTRRLANMLETWRLVRRQSVRLPMRHP
jgi:hypothetical protein